MPTSTFILASRGDARITPMNSLQDMLRQHQIEARLLELEQGFKRVAALRRQRESADEEVSLWDRVNVFTDSPEELRVKQLDAELASEERATAARRAELERVLAEVEGAFPVFEVGRRVDAAVRMVRRHVPVEGHVMDLIRFPDALWRDLERLTERILELYVPDFDHTDYVLAMADERRCRAFAQRARVSVRPHATLGIEPLDHEAVLRLVAGHVQDGARVGAKMELEVLEQRLARLVESQGGAGGGLLEGISLPGEAGSGTTALEVSEARYTLRIRQEQVHALLDAALTVYPPLGVYVCAVELLAAMSALHVGPVPDVGLMGDELVRESCEPRALVLAAGLRLRRAFVRAFPGVPLSSIPTDQEPPLVPTGPAPDARAMAHTMSIFSGAMARAGGEALLDPCFAHATARYRLMRAEQRSGPFPPGPGDVVRPTAAAARERLEWLNRTARRPWHAVVHTAQQAASAELPLRRLRDLSVKATRELKNLGIVPELQGESGVVVVGREALMQTLGELRALLEVHFHVGGDRAAWMERVFQRLKRAEAIEAPDPRVSPPTSIEQVVELLASALVETSFRESYQEANTLLERRAAHVRALEELTLRLASDQPRDVESSRDAEAFDSLSMELAALDVELEAFVGPRDELFQRALQVYWPVQVVLEFDGVHEAVAALRPIKETAFDAYVPRHAPVKYVRLAGHTAAIEAMQRWNARWIAILGRQPSWPELLARWALG